MERGTRGSLLPSSLSLCGHGGSQSPESPPQAPGEHSLAWPQRPALCRPLGATLCPRPEAAHARLSVRLSWQSWGRREDCSLVLLFFAVSFASFINGRESPTPFPGPGSLGAWLVRADARAGVGCAPVASLAHRAQTSAKTIPTWQTAVFARDRTFQPHRLCWFWHRPGGWPSLQVC